MSLISEGTKARRHEGTPATPRECNVQTDFYGAYAGLTLDGIYARAQILVRSGKREEARELLTRESIHLVGKVVQAFSSKHEDYREIADELESSAYSALFNAVDAAIGDEASVSHFSGFITLKLKDAVKKTEQNWNGLGQRYEGVRKQRNLCNKISARISEVESEILTADLDRQSILHDERDCLSLELVKASPLAKRALAPDDKEIADLNPFAVPELREVIDSCCQNEQELQVIELRSQAMTDSEVAQKTDLCRQTVLKIRKAVEARFNAKMKAMNREATAFVVSRRVTSSPCSVPSSLAIGA